jgi:hypothetical protein
VVLVVLRPEEPLASLVPLVPLVPPVLSEEVPLSSVAEP